MNYDMKTFYGETELKQSLLKYTKEHQEADSYIRGEWLNGVKSKNGSIKGCFYGCMTQSRENTLEKASCQYGLPLWYVYVTEKIYEGLPEDKWLSFPYEAIELLPVGIDMNKIRSEFNRRLLTDQLRFFKGDKIYIDAINKCIDLYNVPFNQIGKLAARLAAESAELAGFAAESAAESAESAAESAGFAAESAAELTADYAARLAAESVELAAKSASDSASELAVDSTARLASESVARSYYYLWMKEMLFSCIKESKQISIQNKEKVNV